MFKLFRYVPVHSSTYTLSDYNPFFIPALFTPLIQATVENLMACSILMMGTPLILWMVRTPDDIGLLLYWAHDIETEEYNSGYLSLFGKFTYDVYVYLGGLTGLVTALAYTNKVANWANKRLVESWQHDFF